MLQYHITENKLSAAVGAYTAHPANIRSYNDDQIVDLMLRRGTTLTKADILAALEVHDSVVLTLLADGCTVNKRLYRMSPGISGVFDGPSDRFDPSRHKVNINVSAGVDMREAAKEIKTEKVQAGARIPRIQEVTDMAGAEFGTLTPGGVVQLRGNLLKFISNNPDNGIFLIPGSGEEVKLSVIIENKPSRLMAMLPANLPAGTYTLEVRTTYLQGHTKEGKRMRTGRFAHTMRIVL